MQNKKACWPIECWGSRVRVAPPTPNVYILRSDLTSWSVMWAWRRPTIGSGAAESMWTKWPLRHLPWRPSAYSTLTCTRHLTQKALLGRVCGMAHLISLHLRRPRSGLLSRVVERGKWPVATHAPIRAVRGAWSPLRTARAMLVVEHLPPSPSRSG